jgi:hypothetical protein
MSVRVTVRMSAHPANPREPDMTKRIAAAILITLGLAAGAGAVVAAGSAAVTASAPSSYYHG